MIRHALSSTILLAVAFGSVSAQQVQPLGRPVAELPEPFSRINGIRELADGRLVVSDSRDKTLQLIDPGSGRRLPISREGRGPGEFLSIVGLFPLPDDHTLLVDAGNRRFLRISPAGAVAETISPPDLSAGPAVAGQPALPGDLLVLGLLPPRGVDAAGRLYFQRVVFRREGSTASGSDSAAIYRWTIGRPGIEAVGWARSGQSGVVWAPGEAWQVAPDGRIVRAMPEPYRIVLVDSVGRGTAGAAVPHAPIRVLEADREQVRKERAARMTQMLSAEAAASASAGRGTPGPAPALPEIRFAETKPPFYGAESVAVAPDGQIWVLRTRAFGDDVPVYDVFSPAGQLIRRVSLEARSRLLGFGRASVYIARVDEDDLEYLQKYGRP